MDPIVTDIGQPVPQSNVEYWFRIFYECIRGSCYVDVNAGAIQAFLAKLWLWVIGIGYIVAIISIFVLVYCIVRLFELRKREGEYYGKLILAPDEISGGHPRWAHIEELASGKSQSEWRDAIIEADIMLDEVLTKAGYSGQGVGEKLQAADFATKQDAWDAHLVRNQIAHQGSSFDLSETVMRRTLARYENVFRELKAI